MKWEYKTITIERMMRMGDKEYVGRIVEEECNRLGEDGWELVVGSSYQYDGNNPRLLLIFKRPKE